MSTMAVRPGVWKCGGCGKQFTVTVGTIFEDSHIPLNIRLMAIHLVCASKKGMSPHQLHRMLGVTYKSAWFMVHRLRYAMRQSDMFTKMGGTVEIDETYIGGKIKAGQRRIRGQPPPDYNNVVSNKAAVVSLVHRDESVSLHHVQRVTAANLRPIIDSSILPNAVIMTGSVTAPRDVLMGRPYFQVNHFENEYVRRENGMLITTNTVEGFIGLLKRGINGIYHHVGKRP